jgi:hypothetical protein
MKNLPRRPRNLLFLRIWAHLFAPLRSAKKPGYPGLHFVPAPARGAGSARSAHPSYPLRGPNRFAVWPCGVFAKRKLQEIICNARFALGVLLRKTPGNGSQGAVWSCGVSLRETPGTDPKRRQAPSMPFLSNPTAGIHAGRMLIAQTRRRTAPGDSAPLPLTAPR